MRVSVGADCVHAPATVDAAAIERNSPHAGGVCGAVRLKDAVQPEYREMSSRRQRRAERTKVVVRPVTRYSVTHYDGGANVTLAADRMRAMRERRRARGLRELRLIVPDARSNAVRRRVAKAVARLDRASELDALRWIEAVSEFDTR